MTRDACILLVDDDPHKRRTLSHQLKETNHHVIEAGTGTEGLRLAAEQKPDLVMLSMDLHDIDSTEVCQRLKAEPSLTDCLVVVTNNATDLPEDRAEAFQRVSDGFIDPSIPHWDFLSRIEALLRLQRAEKRAAHLSHILRATNAVHELITRERDRNRLIQSVCDLLIARRGYHSA